MDKYDKPREGNDNKPREGNEKGTGTGKQPEYVAYAVTEDPKKGKTFWTRIGAGFKNKEDGITVLLNALPANPKIVLLPPREE